ncbi:MAG: DUF4058 family protein [Gemmataceae bacterium]|nr:DUF4058 family protein [Gemmataceae bacterium]
MRSPFPGMDPFIEGSASWGDFHAALIARIKGALARAVPDRYFVQTDYRSVIEMIETEGREEYRFFPDVGVHRERGGKPGPRGGMATLPAPPLSLRAFVSEEVRESFVEIRDALDEMRLVTAVEVLSPSNKAVGSAGRSEYLRKRQSLMLGSVNLVELDLLRGGERMPMLDPWPDSPYVVMVARVRADHRCDVWPAWSDQPLPSIPFPLREPDADIVVPLQPLLADIYEESRYDRSLDYSRRLKPPLTAGERALLPPREKPRRKRKEERR